ncbi:MAG: hypothetical protein IPO48_18085 [Saprospiraceae bacterium]|nr:hypothetical protein [Saprospiraceae bacterium]MBK9583728.1 hypothetical protein [Saprospiraceae bacterium]HQV66715.1 hypothetical protein [Saprospiraceae bacterium]
MLSYLRLIFFIPIIFLSACYDRKEACLDTFAANYDVTGDDACSGCCTFPSLVLEFTHYNGDSIYKATDTLINDHLQEYVIEDVRYYLSDFTLFQGDSSHTIREKIATENNKIIIANDMKIMRSVDGELNIGTVRLYGKFDSLSFHLGLTEEITNNSFVGLPSNHVLLQNNKLKNSIGETAYFTLKYKRLSPVMDTVSQNIYITDRPNFTALKSGTVITSTKGTKISYPFKADYKVLLQDIDLTLTEDSISKKLYLNLKKMIQPK